MKKHTFYTAVCSTVGLFLAVLCALTITPAAAAVGVALAITPPLGTTVTDHSVVGDAEDRIVPSVSEIIDEYDPELTPFTTLLSRLGGLNDDPRVMSPKAVEFEILERSRFPRYVQIDGVTTAGSAGASKTVDVQPGHIVVPGDILKSFANSTDPELDYIVTEASSTELTIKALPKVTSNVRGAYATAQSFGTVPIFADEEYLLWVGTAKSEADAASRARRMEPTRVLQFIQTLDATAALSDHAMRIQVYGSQSLESDATRQLVEEFRKTREAAYLFQGMKSVTEDENLNGEVQKYWKMTGARGFVNQEIEIPASASVSDIVNFVYDAHEGYEGRVDKLLFAGSELLNKIDLAGAGSTLFTHQEETVFGVTVNRLIGRKGSVDTVWHPMFDEYDISDEGMLIDLRYVGRAVMQEVEERGGDNKQKEYGQMVDRALWQLISKEALVVHKATGDRAVHKRVVLG